MFRQTLSISVQQCTQQTHYIKSMIIEHTNTIMYILNDKRERGDMHRGERLRVLARGTVFNSLLSLRDSRPFLLTLKNEDLTSGACVSKFPKCTMPPGSVRLFFICSLFHSTGLAYVWYGYVAFTRRIGIGYHLSALGNRKVLALEDGQETTCLPLILGFLTAA